MQIGYSEEVERLDLLETKFTALISTLQAYGYSPFV